MNQACVSLEEVFAAAGARAASLVPETSGYLTLAVADATSRLPYLHDDRAVLLTVDGSVMVPRKTTIVAPSEAGRGLRDVLRRLLATSTGSMPGLAGAARPRSEEHDVEHVVADIEAALIPVNRAAAKRALARLARETLRAKEMGKLRKKPSQAPATAKPQAPAAVKPQPAAATASAPAPTAAAPAITAPAAATTTIAPAIAAPPAPPPLVAPHEIPPPPLVEIPPPPLVEIPPPPLVVAPHEAPTASPPAPVAVELSAPPAGCDEASAPEAALHEPLAMLHEPVAAWQGSDATILDPDAMAVLEAHDETATVAGTLVAEISERPPEVADLEDDDALTRPWQPGLAPVTAVMGVVPTAPPAPPAPPALDAAPSPPIDAPQDAPAPAETVRLETPTAAAAQSALFTEPAGTRADELLDAFHAQDHDEALQAAARGLRAFTGVEETPPPAPPRGSARSTAPLFRREAPPVDEDDDLYLPPPRPRSPARSHWPLAVFALGVLVLFAAWLYRPTLAQSFFGLRDRVFPKPAPAALEAPPPASPQIQPEPLTAEPAAPAAPARPREARAADGPQRRRD